AGRRLCQLNPMPPPAGPAPRSHRPRSPRPCQLSQPHRFSGRPAGRYTPWRWLMNTQRADNCL
ncbi:unnamed protein product, partial [Lampetra planeri]